MLAYTAYTQSHNTCTYNLIMGSIKFPKSITQVPMIRIRCMGQRIPTASCEVNHITKEFSYSIPLPAAQKTFYMLITEDVQGKNITQNQSHASAVNTIQYLKILPEQAYTCYKCVLTNQPKNTWRITPHTLDPDTGQIPDDAIIICYNPAYVDRIEGQNKFTLPRIIIKEEILDLVGSNEDFEQYNTRTLLTAMNNDALHAPLNQHVIHQKDRNIITPIV